MKYQAEVETKYAYRDDTTRTSHTTKAHAQEHVLNPKDEFAVRGNKSAKSLRETKVKEEP